MLYRGGLFCDDARLSKTIIPLMLVVDTSRGRNTSVIYPLSVRFKCATQVWPNSDSYVDAPGRCN